MSGETEEKVSGWTVDTLKEHVEHLFADLKLYAEALVVAEHDLRLARREDDKEAIHKAEHAMEKRLDGMNEIREQLRDQATHFAQSDWVTSEIEKLEQTVTRNREDMTGMLPRETFETHKNDLTKWRSGVDAYMAANVGRRDGQADLKDDRRGFIGATVGIIGSAIGVLFLVTTLITLLAK